MLPPQVCTRDVFGGFTEKTVDSNTQSRRYCTGVGRNEMKITRGTSISSYVIIVFSFLFRGHEKLPYMLFSTHSSSSALYDNPASHPSPVADRNTKLPANIYKSLRNQHREPAVPQMIREFVVPRVGEGDL